MAGGRILSSSAQARVEAYLRDERGSVYAMFDSLGISWTHDDVLQYLAGTPVWQALEHQDAAGNALWLALCLAALCVEQLRDERGIRREPGYRF